MNILLGVYACEPNNGSEPEVGWQMVNELAKAMPNDTIYAVTKANNKEVIEAEGYAANIKFFYYAPPQWLTFWKKGGRGIRTYYYLWMIGAALFMKRQKVHFDIVHHVTFVNDWLPSFFSLLKQKNNRFIWGPIGSNDPIRSIFLEGNKRLIAEKVKITLRFLFRKIDPWFYYCTTKADCIIGINNNVKSKLGLKTSKCFIAEPGIALKASDVNHIIKQKKDDMRFTVISVGRLVYIKNFKLTVLAFAAFLKNNPQISNAKLQIVGDGEDRKSLESLVQELDIAKQVEFTGKVTLHEVQEHFAKADLFLFPTLENAGFVILEAMSHALPVLAMQYGGPRQFVISHTQEQLVSSAQTYDAIVTALAKNLETLYKDKTLRKQVGEQNRQDVLDHFTWEAKAQKMKKIYTKVLDEA